MEFTSGTSGNKNSFPNNKCCEFKISYPLNVCFYEKTTYYYLYLFLRQFDVEIRVSNRIPFQLNLILVKLFNILAKYACLNFIIQKT